MLKNNRESIWDSAACCTQDAADPPDLSYPKYLLRPPTASPQRFVSFVAHPYLPKYWNTETLKSPRQSVALAHVSDSPVERKKMVADRIRRPGKVFHWPSEHLEWFLFSRNARWRKFPAHGAAVAGETSVTRVLTSRCSWKLKWDFP